MVGEKISLNSAEKAGGGEAGTSDYPPFDPDKARELIANARISSSVEDIADEGLRQELQRRRERMERDEEIARLSDEAEERLGRGLSSQELQDLADEYDRWLESGAEGEFERGTENIEEEFRQNIEGEGAGEYDFGKADRYQEETFMLAAADSLVGASNIMQVDQVAREASEKASSDGVTVFEALKGLSQESGAEDEDYAAVDLLNAFIDTTATYVISKDEKLGRGFAKGMMTKMEMQIASAPVDRPNPYADQLRVDFGFVRPIAEEFIKGYNPAYDEPDAFKKHLISVLEMEEVDVRGVKRRGEQPSPDVERKIQALKSVIGELERMQEGYEASLKNLRDAAYAGHRVIM